MALVDVPGGIDFDSWYIGNPCPSHITGRAGTIFRNLINTLLVSHCALASPCTYPEDFGPFMDMQCDGHNLQFDFIVVGAGTAGCIIANRLTEIDTWSVLLLEAGGDPTISTEVPKYYMSQQLSCLDWRFKAEKEDGLYMGMIRQNNPWPAGKVLGGSSTIGRMMYTRGTPMDYDSWEELGNTGWNYPHMIQYYRKAEDVRDKELMNCTELSHYHGIGGYLSIDKFGSRESLITSIKDAAKELTYDDNKDLSAGVPTGFINTHATIKDGERASVSKSYLSPIRDRPNLFIVKNALVTKIIFSGKRAVGVEYKWRNETKTRTITVKKEVIICAGTINSPKLLQLSGIGPARHLNSLGIPVISDLRVGCNLQDHVTFVGAVMTMNRTKNEPSTLEDLDAVYEYLSRRTGTLSTIQESEIIGIIGILDDENPDLQMFHLFIRHADFTTFNMWASTMNLTPEVREMYIRLLIDNDLLIIMPVLLKPDSRGLVKIRSSDPMDPPLIISGHLRETSDVDRMLSGIKFITKMADTVALRRHEADLARLNLPGCCQEEFKTDTYWVCSMAHLATTFFDYVGTNKMGPSSDKTAVVDPRLRVYGVKGLRVADASIMPVITTANAMGPTVAIAEKAADLIKEDWLSEASLANKPTGTPKCTTPGDKKSVGKS